MLANVLIGIFFFRFYRKTKDKLLFFFGTAFLLMALERVILVFVEPSRETHGSIYVIRLVAFSLIIFAIVNKNRKPT